MYMCVKGIDYVPSQTFGRSCICVLRVSILYQARCLDGHVYVLGVSMSVQRQDNDQSCICVRCIDVCAKTGQ